MTRKINLDDLNQRMGSANSTYIKRPRAGELLPVSVFAETELGRLSALRVDIDGKTELRLQLRQGERGRQGNVGDTGIQGPTGNPGWVGDRGERGKQGEKGKIGEIGPKGEIGRPGRDGAGVNEYAELRLEVSRQHDITTTFTDTLAEHGSRLLLMNDILFTLRREFEDAVIRGVQQTFISAGGGGATAGTLLFSSVAAPVGSFNVRSDFGTELTDSFNVLFKWDQDNATRLFEARNANATAGTAQFRATHGQDVGYNPILDGMISGAAGQRVSLNLEGLFFGNGGGSPTAGLSYSHPDFTFSAPGAFYLNGTDGIFIRISNKGLIVGTDGVIEINEGIQVNSSKTLRFRNPANTFQTTLIGGAQTANLSYTLPVVAPVAGALLQTTAAGVLSWSGATGTAWSYQDEAFVIAHAVGL